MPTLDPSTLHAGTPLADARAAVILVHGRGAAADSIIRLADTLDPDGSREIAWLAPQAADNSWYPYPFLRDLATNEPHRAQALATIERHIALATEAGIPTDRIALIGFSQGACLSLEYAAWGAVPVAFVGALSGGVMGPLAAERAIDADRSGMEVFIGCGDEDDHIPLAYATRSAELFTRAGATVDYRQYEGMPHTINADEIDAFRAALTRLTGEPV